MLSSPLTDSQLASLGILAVASVGDSVFDLMVRARLCADGTARAEDLHRRRVELVNARAQSVAAQKLVPLLSEEESAVFRRGRNAQPGSIPPSASRGEYQNATALEALFGWLYLNGRPDRLRELFEVIIGESA
ncbi:MAG: ribonuclease III [Oscillospiraceae bacterium]|jgi:ribonuclease-3 family protein|nr:ribonuclease III [Oscillospiraceae bacterium]